MSELLDHEAESLAIAACAESARIGAKLDALVASGVERGIALPLGGRDRIGRVLRPNGTTRVITRDWGLVGILLRDIRVRAVRRGMNAPEDGGSWGRIRHLKNKFKVRPNSTKRAGGSWRTMIRSASLAARNASELACANTALDAAKARAKVGKRNAKREARAAAHRLGTVIARGDMRLARELARELALPWRERAPAGIR